jgi:hypothetical protein
MFADPFWEREVGGGLEAELSHLKTKQKFIETVHSMICICVKSFLKRPV